jgi:hypothetical protein
LRDAGFGPDAIIRLDTAQRIDAVVDADRSQGHRAASANFVLIGQRLGLRAHRIECSGVQGAVIAGVEDSAGLVDELQVFLRSRLGSIPRGCLHRDSRSEDAREIGNPEQEDQEHWKDERKLNHRLA